MPCRLLAVDIYSFDFKLSHIAQHVQLPLPPSLGDLSGVPAKERLPPLLVVNIQLPDYPVTAAPLLLYCCHTAAVLLFYCCSTAALLLCCCCTAALPLLYCCCTADLQLPTAAHCCTSRDGSCKACIVMPPKTDTPVR